MGLVYSASKGINKDSINMKLAVAALAGFVVLLIVSIFALNVSAATGGFDENGYNYKARIFVGPADGADKKLDGMVWGDSVYAADHLVMKWNKAWDDCNTAGYDNATVCAGAWTTNQWNGMNPDGSQTIYSYKMIWVGSLGETSPYWKEGGDLIWGNYEIIAEQGMEDGEHFMMKAVAPGLGRQNLN